MASSQKRGFPSTLLRVMTFNIRFDNPEDGEHRWELRKDLVVATLLFHKPDVIGLQEALHRQLHYLKTELGHLYEFVGVGRDDGAEKGEYSAVGYLKERFTELHRSWFWLSETPETPGSKSWGSCCTRMATIAVLHDSISDEDVLVANTHLDHHSEKARINGAKLIMTNMRELWQKYTAGSRRLHGIVMGDLNTLPHSPAYDVFAGGRATRQKEEEGEESDDEISTQSNGPELVMTDSAAASAHPVYGPSKTFTSFQLRKELELCIDFIFVDRAYTKVWQYGVVSHEFEHGRLASDHRPVVADLVL